MRNLSTSMNWCDVMKARCHDQKLGTDIGRLSKRSFTFAPPATCTCFCWVEVLSGTQAKLAKLTWNQANGLRDAQALRTMLLRTGTACDSQKLPHFLSEVVTTFSVFSGGIRGLKSVI